MLRRPMSPSDPQEPDDAAEPASEPREGTTETGKGALTGLLRHSLIYSLVPFIRQAISVAMTRVYTGWLVTAKYGVKENVDIWMIAGQQLLGQNLLGGMVRFYFEHKELKDRKAVVSTCTILLTIVAWAVCGTALMFSETLAPILLGRGSVDISAIDLQGILQVMLLLIPFQLSSLCGLYYLQILKRSELYSGIQIAKLFVEIGMNFVLMGHYEMGVRGFLLSMLIGEMLLSIGLTGWTLWRVGSRIDFGVLRPILAYAIPLVPVGLCQTGLHQLDRRLLEHLSDGGFADVGVYGLGYKLGYLVTAVMLGPFLQIWHPWIFGVEDPKERARLVARVNTYTLLAVGLVTIGVIVFGRQGILLISGDREYWWAFQVIPILATGYAFWALYHATQIPLLIAKRTGRLFLINAIALGANIALNVLLIPPYGMVGAALATLLTFATLAGLGMWASYSEAHVPFEGKRLGITLLCIILAALITLLMDLNLAADDNWSFFAGFPMKIALVVMLEAMLFTAVLYPEERKNLLDWGRQKIGIGKDRP